MSSAGGMCSGARLPPRQLFPTNAPGKNPRKFSKKEPKGRLTAWEEWAHRAGALRRTRHPTRAPFPSRAGGIPAALTDRHTPAPPGLPRPAPRRPHRARQRPAAATCWPSPPRSAAAFTRRPAATASGSRGLRGCCHRNTGPGARLVQPPRLSGLPRPSSPALWPLPPPQPQAPLLPPHVTRPSPAPGRAPAPDCPHL